MSVSQLGQEIQVSASTLTIVSWLYGCLGWRGNIWSEVSAAKNGAIWKAIFLGEAGSNAKQTGIKNLEKVYNP